MNGIHLRASLDSQPFQSPWPRPEGSAPALPALPPHPSARAQGEARWERRPRQPKGLRRQGSCPAGSGGAALPVEEPPPSLPARGSADSPCSQVCEDVAPEEGGRRGRRIPLSCPRKCFSWQPPRVLLPRKAPRPGFKRRRGRDAAALPARPPPPLSPGPASGFSLACQSLNGSETERKVSGGTKGRKPPLPAMSPSPLSPARGFRSGGGRKGARPIPRMRRRLPFSSGRGSSSQSDAQPRACWPRRGWEASLRAGGEADDRGQLPAPPPRSSPPGSRPGPSGEPGPRGLTRERLPFTFARAKMSAGGGSSRGGAGEQAVLAPAPGKAGQGRELPSPTSTKTLGGGGRENKAGSAPPRFALRTISRPRLAVPGAGLNWGAPLGLGPACPAPALVLLASWPSWPLGWRCWLTSSSPRRPGCGGFPPAPAPRAPRAGRSSSWTWAPGARFASPARTSCRCSWTPPFSTTAGWTSSGKGRPPPAPRFALDPPGFVAPAAVRPPRLRAPAAPAPPWPRTAVAAWDWRPGHGSY